MPTLNKIEIRKILYLITGVSLTIGLITCGGGGSSGSGGGGGSSVITLPTAPVTITQQNAPQVAGAAFDALYGSTSLPTAGVQTSMSAQPAASYSASSAQTVAKIVQTAAQQIVSQGAAPSIATGAVQTISCPFGGTVSISQTSPTSGTATYSNCSNVAGVTLNGTMSLSHIATTPTSMSVDAVFNLKITTVSPANTLTAIGDMHLFLDFNTFAISMSGSRLAMGNADAAMGNLGLLNYMIVIDGSGAFTTLTFTFASTAINGTAVFEMTTPLVGPGMFPSSGAATITGANSTVLKLTVLGNETFVGSQVKLELSTDGGINYDAPTYHTWAEISSRI